MGELKLSGLIPTSPAPYLAALGLLRLVAEQKDPDSRLGWEGDCPVLVTRLKEQELEDFLLNEYRPTPILAPWNRDSGFWRQGQGGQGRGTDEPLQKVEGSEAERLKDLREAIKASREIVGKEKKAEKARILARCRARWPEAGVAWLDAVGVVVPEGTRVKFQGFPLLGQGGVDGRREFGRQFLKALVRTLPELGANEEESLALLRLALWNESPPEAQTPSRGQPEDFSLFLLHPFFTEAPNAAQGAKAKGRGNPWLYILALEGAVLWAAGVVRRHPSGPLRPAFPFTVETPEEGLGEVWFPLWSGRATLREVERLFREGRLQWGRRQARLSIDAFRAVASLGVDRGVRRFLRFQIRPWSGKAHIAVPAEVEAVEVPEHPRPRVHLLGELDGWLEELRSRRKDLPRTWRAEVAELERAVERWCRTDQPKDLQEVLVRLGRLEMAMARTRGRVSAGGEVRPFPGLSDGWAEACDDGSREFDLARALASLSGRPGPLRAFLEPVRWRGEVWRWEEGASAVLPLSPAHLAEALLLRARRSLEQEEALGPEVGKGAWPARWSSVSALVRGEVRLERLTELVRGLALVREWRGRRDSPSPSGEEDGPHPLVLALKLGAGLLARDEEDRRRVDLSLLRILKVGEVAGAVERALRRLRALGLPLWADRSVSRDPGLPRHDPSLGLRLLLALLCPSRPCRDRWGDFLRWEVKGR